MQRAVERWIILTVVKELNCSFGDSDTARDALYDSHPHPRTLTLVQSGLEATRRLAACPHRLKVIVYQIKNNVLSEYVSSYSLNVSTTEPSLTKFTPNMNFRSAYRHEMIQNKFENQTLLAPKKVLICYKKCFDRICVKQKLCGPYQFGLIILLQLKNGFEV